MSKNSNQVSAGPYVLRNRTEHTINVKLHSDGVSEYNCSCGKECPAFVKSIRSLKHKIITTFHYGLTEYNCTCGEECETFEEFLLHRFD